MRKCTENDICLRHADWLREYTASLRPPMRRDDAYSTALYALLHAIRTAGPADDFRPYTKRCVRLFLKIECDRERRSRRCERYNASLDRRIRADGAALFLHFRHAEGPSPAAALERKDFLSTLPAEEREFVEDVYAGCPTEELKHKYADFEGIRSRVREYYLAYHA